MAFRRTRVKVCCIKNEQGREIAIQAGADALGLVGPMPSGPGMITDAVATHLVRDIPPPIASFLLSSEETAPALKAHADRVGASTLQIVRHIDPMESKALYETSRTFNIVQVIHVEDERALDLIAVYSSYVDAFLLDSGKPQSKTPTLGGTGNTHDWEVSRAFVERSAKPVFLAGGLTPENAGEAIRTVKPYGLDLCSGVRTDGRLNAEKLARFMTSVRQADQSQAA